MKAKAGIAFMLLGAVMVAAALGLFLHNAREQKLAQDAVDMLMPQLVEAIHIRHETPAAAPTGEPVVKTDEVPQITQPLWPVKEQMPVARVDGYDYVGFVGIPTLGLELPVMEDWSYKRLQIAPCRFTGDMYSDNLVVMAHNYESHFGNLKNLRVGDAVTVTDMDGLTVEYAVVAMDVLEPGAVEEMAAGEFDLTLFTCTYGGEKRVTVRCDRVGR